MKPGRVTANLVAYYTMKELEAAPGALTIDFSTAGSFCKLLVCVPQSIR